MRKHLIRLELNLPNNNMAVANVFGDGRRAVVDATSTGPLANCIGQ